MTMTLLLVQPSSYWRLTEGCVRQRLSRCYDLLHFHPRYILLLLPLWVLSDVDGLSWIQIGTKSLAGVESPNALNMKSSETHLQQLYEEARIHGNGVKIGQGKTGLKPLFPTSRF